MDKQSKFYQIPGTFYIRDIELKHIRILLRAYLSFSNQKGRISRKQINDWARDSLGISIASNSYNHFITLSSLNLITSRENILTSKGLILAKLAENNPEIFFEKIIKIFVPYMEIVVSAFLEIIKETGQDSSNFKVSSKKISNKIEEIYGEKIRFLGDPRTTGNVMRILIEVGIVEKKIGGYSFNQEVYNSLIS